MVFTLVEILVVILIIGLLFVFLVPKISSASDKAKESGVKTDMHSYQVAFESVAKEEAGFGFADDDTDIVSKVNGYLDEALWLADDGNIDNKIIKSDTKKDPWNQNYWFSVDYDGTSNNGSIKMCCSGKSADGVNSEYSLKTSCIDGEINTVTEGFSKNIGTSGSGAGEVAEPYVGDDPSMFNYANYNGGIKITGFNVPDSGTWDVKIPAEINGLPVIRIEGNGLLMDYEGQVTSLYIPDSVVEMDNTASIVENTYNDDAFTKLSIGSELWDYIQSGNWQVFITEADSAENFEEYITSTGKFEVR